MNHIESTDNTLPQTTESNNSSSTCRVLELGDELRDFHASWLELIAQDQKATIFHHPDYLFQVVRMEGGDSNALPRVIIDFQPKSRARALAVLIPKMLAMGGILRFLGRRLKVWRLAGDDVLAEPSLALAGATADGLLSEMKSGRIDMLLIEIVPEDSRIQRFIQSLESKGCSTFSPSGCQPHLKIQLPASQDEYWSAFKSKTRNTLKRVQRKFGEFQVVRYTEESQISEFLEQAHSVSIKSWQSRRLGTRIKNDEEEKVYLRFLAKNGAFRSYILFQDNTPMAFVQAHQYGGTFFYDELGYDSSCSHLAPGKVLLVEIINDLFKDNQPTELDFGFGDAEYKRLFSNQTGSSSVIWLFRPGWRSRLIVGYLRTRRQISQLARSVLDRVGLLRRVRRFLRR